MKEKQQSEQKKETNVRRYIVSRETILSGTNMRKMYKLFRADKLNRLESLYNAAYLTCYNKYELSNTDVKPKYANIHQHPIAWAQDKIKFNKHNKWSYAIKMLDGTAKVIKGAGVFKKRLVASFGKIKYIPTSLDNSLRAAKTLGRITSAVLIPVIAVSLTAYTAYTISSTVKNDGKYAIGVYIDGEYVGNTLSLNEITKIKHDYESSLTTRYGTPVVLECKVEYIPQHLDTATLIANGDNSIFDTYIQNYTQQGYGLYIDNKLAAVTYAQKWFDDAVEESILQQKSNYMAENYVSEREVDEFVYNNNISIIADNYPSSYFLTQSEVRRLFGLPELADEEYSEDAEQNASKNRNDGKNPFTSTLNLDYSDLETRPAGNDSNNNGLGLDSATLSGAVSIDIATTRDETVYQTVPYDTEYVYDEDFPEGMRRLVSSGKNGQKAVYYKSTYNSSGKLVKQELSGEEITKNPVNKVIKVGTKVLSEDEKGIIPTGTYIWPCENGDISSNYGWRVLRGKYNFHIGLDIHGPYDEPILAADGGEVIEVGYNRSYGNYVEIQHDEDTITKYAHCAKLLVEAGQFVAKGETIATMGSTGDSTGVHVHFEIIENGTSIDPTPLLPER